MEGVHDYFWSPPSAVLQIGCKCRLWRVDPAQPAEENWHDIKHRGFKCWSIQSSPHTSNVGLVITSSDRNLAFSYLYTTHQDCRDKTLFIKSEGQSVGWLLGLELNPQLRFDRIEDNQTRLGGARDSSGQICKTYPSTVFSMY